jgi:FtsH-binding integral membrane protein
MSNVFSWMSLALVVSGVFAYLFGTSTELIGYIYNLQTGGMTIFGYLTVFGPFILVLIMGMRFQKLSYGSMVILYAVFSALMGISLSSIFLIYTMGSIAKVFFITAATFGAMALVGYTTKTDLTKFGSILYMALIGIIIASVVNWFMHSAQMDYIISILGVLIFTGLTAYDVQKLKRIGMGLEYQDENTNKLVLMGALSLYLDFINLFLFLLRLFGDRK